MAGLARAAIRFRYFVIAFWIAATVLTIGLFSPLSSVVNTDNSSFLPSSSPSAQAARMGAPFLPEGDSDATLVVTTTSPTLTPSEQSAIASLETLLAKLDHVVSVSDQGPSHDGRAQKALVVAGVQPSSSQAEPLVDAMRSAVTDAHLPSTLSAHFTGSLPTAIDNQDAQASAQRRDRRDLQGRPPGLDRDPDHADRPAAGAGTDYGLFLILRVREEIARGASPRGAIERTARHVGESITFSAGTVVVALLALLLASFGLYSGLGPALAVGIALMLLAALTLLPALLAVFGRAVHWPHEVKGPAPEGMWIRVAERVVAHPAATLVAGRSCCSCS